MADITPALVGKLREMTNAGLMDCKNALVEAAGDLQGAVDILRKKGQASAAKKAGREAKDGLIAQAVLNGRIGALVEVNCETDFVARNESFKAFCNELAVKVASNSTADLEGDRVSAVAKIGENIQIRRHQRLEVSGNGLIAAYIHTGGKVGVLVEVGASKPETTQAEEFKQLVRDITLQIAASHPIAIHRGEVPAAILDKEREIAAQSDAVRNRPQQAVAKIIEGKLNKFLETACLLEQGFVKNPDLKVEAHVASVGKGLDDSLQVRRFLRYQVGEAV